MSKIEPTNSPSTSVEDKEDANHPKNIPFKPRNSVYKGNQRNKPYGQSAVKRTSVQPPRMSQPEGKLGFTNTVVAKFKFDIWLTGVEDIAKVCYNTMKYYDNKCCMNITIDQFVHICKMVAFLRLYDVSLQLGSYWSYEINIFPQLTQSYFAGMYPQMICSYCEAIGEVNFDFTTVIPGVVTMREFFRDKTRNIFIEIDPETGRNRLDDNGHTVPCTMDNFYTQYPIGHYTTAITRSVVMSKAYRSIQLSTNGQKEFLCSYKRTRDTYVRSYAVTSLPTEVANRGGAFRYRQEDRFTEWLFDSNYLRSRFQSEEYDSILFIAEAIRRSWERL